MISMIMPVFQAKDYLNRAVDSVLAQTYNNWELILINDGSTDGSENICDEYARQDKRIRVFHQANQGQASARNAGMEVANGDYIGFIDNDDSLYPQMLEILTGLISEYETVDICSCSFIQQNENGEFSHDKHTDDFFLFDNLGGMTAFLERKYMDIYVWTKLYKKSFLDTNNIRFEKGRGDEDFLFNRLAFTNAQVIILTDTPLYIYNYREESASRLQRKNIIKYLDDTSYRTNLIEKTVEEKYPQLLYLAKRQTILYMFMMLCSASQYYQKGCWEYYIRIKSYLYANRLQVLKDRKYWGISLIGVLLAIYLPDKIYLLCKKIKFKL